MKKISVNDSLNNGKDKINLFMDVFDHIHRNTNTNLTTETRNLFNTNLALGGSLLSLTGDINEDRTYSLSDYIPVKPGTIYYFNDVTSWGIFDKEKNFIKRLNFYESYEMKENEYYIRLNVLNTKVMTAWVSETQLSQYESGSVKLKESLLPAIPGEMIKDGDLSPEKTNFFKISTNLFDINNLNHNIVINDKGVLTSNNTFSTSDFIKVDSSLDYMANGGAAISQYYKDKKFIYRNWVPKPQVGENASDLQKITLDPRTSYIRVSANTARLNYMQLVQSSVPIPYEVGGARLKPYYLDGNTLSESIKRDKKYIPSIKGESVFNSNTSFEDMYSQIVDSTDKLNDIYTRYDALVAENPSYVSKTNLGADSVGNQINRYDFKPIKQKKSQADYPKIIIVTNTHGPEMASVWTLIHTMENIVKNWQENEVLETLRFNFHFIIIPVANPYGLINQSRYNENNIDLNRNFENNYKSGVDYSGTTALSENSAKFINNVIQENKDAIMFIDFHNFFTHTEDPYLYLWVLGSDKQERLVAESFINKMNSKFIKEHTFFTEDKYVGYSDLNQVPGSMQGQAKSYGLPMSYTFEISNRIAARPTGDIAYDSLTMKLGYESFVNFLLTCLREYYK